MSAYYNEIDPYAAQWLRNLISAGHIADGVVDERSSTHVHPSDLSGFNQCHFFAGIGVWSHALRKAGWDDSRPVWTGSCPCQPFSSAGNQAGVEDERHLWPVWFNLIEKCRPPVVFGEQVEAAIHHNWLDHVQSDLEGGGYAFAAAGIPAAGVGAPHIRQRLFFVGDAEYTGLEGHTRTEGARGRPGWVKQNTVGSTPPASVHVDPQPTNGFWRDADWLLCRDGKRRPVEPGTFPLGDGFASRVGRLRAYGNAIVPQVAQSFIEAHLHARTGV